MNDLLSNTDIEQYCKQLKIPLNAILQKDLYKSLIPKEGAYVINLQDSNVGNGTHWTALYVFPNHIVYNDSFGFPIPTPIIRFISRYKPNKRIKIYRSTDQIQDFNSIYCGWYCLFFLYYMNRNKRSTNIRELLNKHNALYSMKDKKDNDRKLQSYIGSIFRKTT